MRLWVLSHLSGTQTTRMLIAEAKNRGHKTALVNPSAAHFLVTALPGTSSVHIAGKPAELPDAVLTRMGSSSPGSALHFLRHLERRGVCCINSSAALEKSRDKIRAFEELASRDIPVPKTIAIGANAPLDQAVEAIPGPPWILKLPVSTQGKGVMFIDSILSLRSIVDSITSLQGRLLLQEFITESSGADIRVLVLDGLPVAAMKRSAAPGDFRSNLHRGGSAIKHELDEELTYIAGQAAAALGLTVAGVDVLQSKSGYRVIEVNSSPGLEGLQAVHSENLAVRMVKLIEHSCGPGKRLR